tara:strand:+ start:1613 stop:3022 length:1410 start_codon:yes stop_codon:yes gene_type:complete
MGNIHELVIIGSGPGGYACAFRAADLGVNVTLIEKNDTLGGVCLNKGCIPSKAFLHIAKVMNDAKSISKVGVSFDKPNIDVSKINQWKNDIVNNLSSGIEGLAKRRKVNIINGEASFNSATELKIRSATNEQNIQFKHCVIATGSSPTCIPNIEIDHELIIDSTDALNFTDIPKNMLIIGGGYIGLEMATFYQSVGSSVDIAEFLPEILSDMDNDLVKVLFSEIKDKFNVMTNTKVKTVNKVKKKAQVEFETKDGKTNTKIYDKVLVCVGRKPNTQRINIENAGLEADKYGFIQTNLQGRTLIPNIFGIGDIVGNPMLAHKATHQGKVVAEVISGKNHFFEPKAIPYVIFTDPEIAWAGPSIQELEKSQIKFKSKIFPWQANGRALSLGAVNGRTKIIYDESSEKIISIGIVGPHAGDLIGEAALAIEMDAMAEDISLTIHPHPTLTETIANTAEMIEGTITDLYYPKK